MLPTTQQQEQTTIEKSDTHSDLQLNGKQKIHGEAMSDRSKTPVPKTDDQDNTSLEVLECVNPVAALVSDEKQKVLLEAVVTHTKKEAELRALIAAFEENAKLKQIELEIIAQERADAEKLLAATEQENDRVKAELSCLVPTSMNGMSGTSTIASSATRLSASVLTLEVIGCDFPTEEKVIVEEPLKAGVHHYGGIEALKSHNAELRTLCCRLEGEKATLRSAYERKLAAMEEKMTIVATLASSHLTGRMGLECRLQACEKERATLAMDSTLSRAQDDVVVIGKNMELRALSAEIGRLRRMVNDARASQRVAEDEVARLAALELDSYTDGLSVASSVFTSSMASAMGGDGDDISDCSTK